MESKNIKLRAEMFEYLSGKITRPIAFFDIESTGLDVDKDQIIQLNIQVLSKDGIDNHTFWVMPDVDIKPSALEVHGITREILIEKGAVPFKDIAVEVSDIFSNCDLGGYNILRFDIPMLEAELWRASIEADYSQRNIIDAASMYRKLYSHSLIAAYENLIGTKREIAHEAEQDVLDTMIVLHKMVLDYDEIGDDNDEWIEFASKGSGMVDYAGKFIMKDNQYIFGFGKDYGKPVHENTDMLKWMLTKDFSRNTKIWCHQLLTLIQETGESNYQKAEESNENNDVMEGLK